jgi:hypothetical protein
MRKVPGWEQPGPRPSRGEAGCLDRMQPVVLGPNDIQKGMTLLAFWMLCCARSSPSYGLTNDRSSPSGDEEKPSLPALFA